MNWLLRLTARALEAREREAVLGDLAECGLTGARAWFDVFGLVVRRQLLLWTHWRPWFALIGIAGISGFCLRTMMAALSFSIFEQTTAWVRYGVHYNTGVTSFREDVIYMISQACAIFWWSAVNAALLRRWSGAAGWLTGLLFYLPVVRWALPLNLEWICLAVLLLAIPAICGIRGKLSVMVPATVLFTFVAALIGWSRAHDLQAFSNGELPAAPWFAILAPYALVSWPVLLIRGRLRGASRDA